MNCKKDGHGPLCECEYIDAEIKRTISSSDLSEGLDLLDSLREALDEIERQHNEDEEGVNGWQIGVAQIILTGLELELRKQA